MHLALWNSSFAQRGFDLETPGAIVRALRSGQPQ
jgi:hypothetical protein